MTISAKLGLTGLFVFLNGFFVAAEFALVKLRPARIDSLAKRGNRRAKLTQRILADLDLYLSGCQLGITLASLILGWLAEPAVASLLLVGADSMGWDVHSGLVHGVSLGIALAVITLLHMTVGEQAPKIWALQRSESVSLLIAYPLFGFVSVLRPLIWMVNSISNALLRVAGITSGAGHDSVHSAREIREILVASAHAGQISSRQRTFAANVMGLVDLEVRHIMLPRVDVTFLSLQDSLDESLAKVRESKHSRFPLCEKGLDSVVGMVHSRDILDCMLADETVDLRKLARPPMLVPDTQPLTTFILEAQSSQRHAAVVVDEHGTTVGLSFLEDALEEIVGPLHDEFDKNEDGIVNHEDGLIDVAGGYPLPDLAMRLGVNLEEDTDTIGGYVVARLGRLPKVGDTVELEGFLVTVIEATRRRIVKVRLESLDSGDDDSRED